VAVRAGAALAILNRDETPLDRYADVKLRLSIGAVFEAIYPQVC
jgi:hypothetical protein